MAKNEFQGVKDRFLRYVKVDTQSEENAETFPSTDKQKDLAKILLEELEDLGLEAEMDEEYGYVYAKIPSSIEDKEDPRNKKVIGFVAHMDTSPSISGKDVNPQIVEDYQGQVIDLGHGYELKPEEFPELKNYVGQDLITTDGTTLLGADDKAGLAEIMTMAEYLVNHPELEHGEISICFTPDEEVGRGVDFIDLDKLGADFAYTIDGGEIGELEFENFNAASATVEITGKSVHPGSAKRIMINASDVAVEFAAKLPEDQVPRKTEGYEGFFFLEHLEGEIEEARMDYIIRDHDRAKFEEKKVLMQEIADEINEEYGEDIVTVTMEDSYYNMKEKLAPHMFLIDKAEACMEKLDIKPIISPIRGGTDGARLSYMGLPCPNISTGGHNYHGRYEYVPIQSMEKISELLVLLAQEVFAEEV